MRSGLRLLLLSTLVVLVSACASNKQEEVLPEKTYYENAREAMTSGNFNEAEQNLDALETYYPFGRYAEQAPSQVVDSGTEVAIAGTNRRSLVTDRLSSFDRVGLEAASVTGRPPSGVG